MEDFKGICFRCNKKFDSLEPQLMCDICRNDPKRKVELDRIFGNNNHKHNHKFNRNP